MRFLCLHGMGTSGRIFEAQMSQIAAAFSGQHEFCYIDGSVETEALAGMLRMKHLWRLTTNPW